MIGLLRNGDTPPQRRRGPSEPARAADRPGKPEGRDAGLDALRAATMFLVVALHAALGYAQVPIPNLIWAVHDACAQPAFDGFCWWALGISSPFYLMSGFFAADLYQARGPGAFLKNRVKRIGVPFLVGGLIILPATFFVWAGGWLIAGQCSTPEILRLKFDSRDLQQNLYGPAHLWSLEYLAIMLFGFWLIQGLRRLAAGRSGGTAGVAWTERWLLSPWRPLLLAVPTTLILWVGHEHVGLDALLDRQNSFFPEPFRLLHNALFFAVGVGLQRSRHGLGRLIPHGGTYLVLSVPVFVCRAWLIRQDLGRPLGGPASWALAASGALVTWLTTFGLLSLAQRFANRPRPAARYLADSSYWIYLCHLPIVGLVQVDLASVPVPAALKFLVVLATTLGLGLASYQVLVRYTVIGTWLHGRRERLPQRPPEDRVRVLPLSA